MLWDIECILIFPDDHKCGSGKLAITVNACMPILDIDIGSSGDWFWMGMPCTKIEQTSLRTPVGVLNSILMVGVYYLKACSGALVS